MSDSSNSTASKPEVPALGKYLASTEKKTRDKAIKSLATFLSDDSQKSMSPLERAKLWKGLFYCFWMSDKPLVQQELSSELANLALVIPSLDSAVGFIRGFWEAMVREWAGIDRYSPDDKKVPASLSYHLADIYLEELDKALDISNNDHNLPLITLLKPFINLSAYTPNKITYSRMQTALLTPLLDELIFRATSSNDETTEPQPRKRKRSSEAYPNIIESVCKHTSKAQDMPSAENPQIVAKEVLNAVFEVAGHTDTKDANRRKMYALWKQRMEEIEGPPEGDGVN
ncbi:Ribosomal RNA processing protein 1 homolog A AltName: Full=Novel nuclear protein 1 [Rhizoctonia solani AG-1 IB]|uniref:D21S2056E protein n=1 Tax=Thanatephorus cucumeris (strain AG1-IB / isolate 7/3/14) TaxID=1108050 RepID=M5BRI1_THACB|nr:Ribosomal RNA processing protein 1 homolog A AltName: Full=Novel nuclear protein 1 [Rhizoctonia solani AG-1 IB]